MKNKGTQFLAEAAVIGAIYVVLTLLFAPLSYGEIQIRFSEALTILPFFTPAAIPGLFVGCIIANLFGGAIPVDIIFGSIATLIGAVFTYRLRSCNRFLAPIPPIVSNAVIVPFVLHFGYGVNLPIPLVEGGVFSEEVNKKEVTVKGVNSNKKSVRITIILHTLFAIISLLLYVVSYTVLCDLKITFLYFRRAV